MKIKCRYCNNFMNDTDDICPSCGAQNEDVVRTAKSQPQTIEELKQWYTDRGLPPYETTRFFIGINYQKPRAFGIYKESTGKCVVYKNKDSGQRAIRYEGTDEAYAVNEIYQRLKQEIIEQKMNNVKKNQSGASGSGTRNVSGSGTRNALGSGTRNNANYSSNSTAKRTQNYSSSSQTQRNNSKHGSGSSKRSSSSALSGLKKILLIICAPFALLLLAAIIIVIVENNPSQGYYSYNGETYYYNAEDYHSKDLNWYKYDENDWAYPVSASDMPEEMRKNKTAKAYYLCYDWEDTLPCDDFNDSVYYADMKKGFSVSSGYYKCGEDDYYYHLGTDYDSGWYHYSDEEDWTSTDVYDVPEDLLHPSIVEDFYYTPTWDASTQLTDFTDSTVYEEYQAEQARIEAERERARQESNERSYSYDDDWGYDDDDDYDWDYGSDSWDSGYSDWDSDW